jgi:RND superfamily putative drug exporter
MIDRLTDLADRRRRWVLVGVLPLVVVAVLVGGPVAGLLSGGGESFEDSSSESVAARVRLEEASGESPEIALVALVETGADVRTDAAAKTKVEDVAAAIAGDPAVVRTITFFDTNDDAFVSLDGTTTYVLASFEPLGEVEAEEAAVRIQDLFTDDDAVTIGGGEIAGEQVGEQVGEDLARAEIMAFPILFALSFFIFRGLVAALLPLLCGLISIVVTFLVLRAGNELTPLSIFALNLVTGLGLGLAIDYSLFIVSRYREELIRVGPGREALRRTLATAGRTVTYSALTVAAALASLLIFPQPFLYSMGIGGVAVALISAATALVVLPATLAALGTRVNAIAPARWRQAAERTARAEQSGFWYRHSWRVMRYPGPIALATATLLVVLGLPFLSVKFTGVDASVLPESASARQVDDALRTEFPPRSTSPIYLAIDAPSTDDAKTKLEDYAARLGSLDGVESMAPLRDLGSGLWQLEVTPQEPALTESSKKLVRDVRAEEAPFPVAVGGESAAFVDQQDSLEAHLPWGLIVLAAGTFVFLFAMTGSLLIPIKTFVLNLLTLSATFGILVFVFQEGRLEGLLDYRSAGALDSTQPILLFAVAFALSTDYAVFLLTRIKEARDSGLPNTEAVATGLERTGRIVTSAALLFSIAVAAFSTSEIAFIKEVGIGIALAVIIDASIVRALLVPSLMELLGDWNWWAPEPLRRLHRRFGLSEGEVPPPDEAWAGSPSRIGELVAGGDGGHAAGSTWLRVTAGPLAGQAFEASRELVVGRENADLLLDDAQVSRRHAVIRPLPGGAEIEDLGSLNGTWMNGRRLDRPARLGAGDVVTIGRTRIDVDVRPAPTPSPAARPGATILREDELRPVTVLLADVVGPASLWERLPAERTQQLIDGCLERMTVAAAQRGGMVQLHAHNAILAYFGVPARREDDVDRTADAALSMVEDMTLHAAAVAQSWNVEAVHVRVAIEGGAVAGEAARSSVRDVVAGAGVLQAGAAPDTIVVGEAVARALEPRFALLPLGGLPVAGSPAPVAAWRLTGRRPGAPAA